MSRNNRRFHRKGNRPIQQTNGVIAPTGMGRSAAETSPLRHSTEKERGHRDWGNMPDSPKMTELNRTNAD